jgi:hypothetical protein
METYRFDNADLSVFSGIAGTLHCQDNSKAVSRRSLSELKPQSPISDSRVRAIQSPLHTSFEALVDGTIGDTLS